jgi:hypothetical protein
MQDYRLWVYWRNWPERGHHREEPQGIQIGCAGLANFLHLEAKNAAIWSARGSVLIISAKQAHQFFASYASFSFQFFIWFQSKNRQKLFHFFSLSFYSHYSYKFAFNLKFMFQRQTLKVPKHEIFDGVFFASKEPIWSRDSWSKIVSNINLNSLRYSIK